MSRMYRPLALLAATAMAVTLSACATADPGGTDEPNGDESKGAVAMGFPGADVTIWNDQLEIMRPLIEEAGYEFLTDDPQWDITKQVASWQAWVDRGDVKAIMGMPVQVDSMIPVTEAATAAGIPVFGYLLTWEGVEARMGADSYQGGYDLAVNAGEELTEEGRTDVTVVLVGDRSDEFIASAMDGLVAGVKDSLPDAKIVEQSGANRQDGYDAAQAQLTADPNSYVWLGASSETILGVYQALADRGVAPDDQDYYLASRDATNETLDLIKIPNSLYRTSIAYKIPEIAQANVDLLLAGAEGRPAEDIIVQPHFVTAENADEFYVD